MSSSSYYNSIEHLVRHGIPDGSGADEFMKQFPSDIRQINRKMRMLPTTREAEAEPELTFLREVSFFMRTESFMVSEQQIFENETIERLFFEELLTGVVTEFLKTRIYTSKTLIGIGEALMKNLVHYCTSRLSLGKISVYGLLNSIIDKNAEFYSNGRENSLGNWAFGVSHEVDENMKQWIDNLVKGEAIDCARTFSNKQIWSRAYFEIKEKNYIRVRFFGEKTLSLISNPYIDIRPYKTHSIDFDWRQSLKEGDFVDYFTVKYGWALSKVISVEVDQFQDGETSVYIEIERQGQPDKNKTGHGYSAFPYHSTEDFSHPIRLNVGYPIIARPNTFSTRSSHQVDDVNDEMYMTQETELKFVILRPLTLNGAASIYFVRFGNIFGQEKGFKFILTALSPENHGFRFHFLEAVSLIKNFCENIVRPFILENGAKMMENILIFLRENFENNIRSFSQQNITAFIEAISALNTRLHDETYSTAESMKCAHRIVVVCLKSEILEKQFFAAKILAESETNMKNPAYSEIVNDLADQIIKDNIFELIIKGHPSLIGKSSAVVKVLLTTKRITEDHLKLLWSQILKADSESKTALVALTKDVASKMTREQINFFLMRMIENPDDITSEVLELLYLLKNVGSSHYRDNEFTSLFSDVMWKMLQVEHDLKPDICREIMKFFISCIYNNNPEIYFEEIVKNFIEGRQKTRNLKLMLKFARKPSSLYTLSKFLTENKIIDICVNDFCVGLKKYGLKLSKQELPSMTEITVTDNNQTAKGIYKELQRILKFLTIFAEPYDNNLFNFGHFEQIFQAVLSSNVMDEELRNWMKNYITDSKEESRKADCEKFYLKYIFKISEFERDDLIDLLISVMSKINVSNGEVSHRYVKFENSYLIHRQNNESALICDISASKIFGMDELWKIFCSSTNLTFALKVGRIITKKYIAPEHFENENPGIYEEQQKSLTEIALNMFKTGSLNDITKSSMLLIALIRAENSPKIYAPPSYGQLHHYHKISIFVENDSKYQKQKIQMNFSDNQLVSAAWIQIANYFSVAPESIKLQIMNKKVISTRDHFLTLKMMDIVDKDTIIMDDADVPQIRDTPILNQEQTDFTEQVNLVWREIFEEHSVNNIMTPQVFSSFVSKSTNGASCSPNEGRILNVFNKYDPEKRGYLDFEAFMSFFRDSALQSPDRFLIVKQNLQSLGYNPNFKLKKPSPESENFKLINSLRYRLSNDELFFKKLYDSLGHEDLPKEGNYILRYISNVLYVPKIDLMHLLNDPMGFLESGNNIYLWNYKSRIINALIANAEPFVNGIISEIPNGKILMLNLLQTVVATHFLQKLAESSALIEKMQNFPNEKEMTFAPIRLLSKILNSLVIEKKPKSAKKLNQFMNFFSRTKRKLEFSQEKKKEDAIKKKEIPLDKDFETEMMIKTIQQVELTPELMNSIDFESINQKLLESLQFCTSLNADDVWNFRGIIKSIIYALTSSISLQKEKFESFLGTPLFTTIAINGLSASSGFLKHLFKNLFAFITWKYKKVEIKIGLLKVLLANIRGKAGENFSGLVDLSCMILSDVGDIKSKNSEVATYLHEEFNFARLFDEFKSQFLVHQSAESMFSDQEDHLLVSYLAFLENILKADETVLTELSLNDKKQLVQHIFQKCLFNTSGNEISFDGVKCHLRRSREVAFHLLRVLLKGDLKLNINFMVSEIAPLFRRIPQFAPSLFRFENSKRLKGQYLGITNLGCICYMIATVQQLFAVPTFRYGILMGDDKIEPSETVINERKIDDNYFHQFQRLFAYLESSQRKDVSAIEFCLSYKDYAGQPLNVMIQQDADEYFKFLIDKIENALKKSPFLGILSSTLMGKLCNVIKCQGCGFEKLNEEVFCNLSLEVKNMKNTTESLEKLIEPEIISDYTCDNCKKKVDISKQGMLHTLPNVLFLTLKKMYFDLDQLVNVKLHTRYEFPMSMNLKKYMHSSKAINDDEDYEFKLVGVVIHKGNAEYGHYISLINVNRKKTEEDSSDRWMEFDDCRVSNFDMNKFEEECFGTSDDKDFSTTMFQETGSSKSAYLLVYEKVSKNDLIIDFGEEMIDQKDLVLSSLIDPSKVKWDKNVLHTDFYNLKQFIPEPHKSAIHRDNKMLVMEQHMLSRVFTDGIAGIFKNGTINLEMTEGELKHKKIYADTVLNNLPIFINRILCVTNENGSMFRSIEALTNAMEFMSSVADQSEEMAGYVHARILRFYKEEIFNFFNNIRSIIQESSDSFARKGAMDYFIKTTNILLNHFNVKYLEKEVFADSSLKVQASNLVFKIVYTLGFSITQLENTNSVLRKQEKVFMIVFRLMKDNIAVADFFANFGMLPLIYEMFMKIKSGNNSFMDMLLQVILKMFHFLYCHMAPQADQNPNYENQLLKVSLLDVFIKESQEENCTSDFDFLEDLVRQFCFEKRSNTEMLISSLLKNMVTKKEDEIEETLFIFSSLLKIEDSLSDYRVKLILGVPKLSEFSTNSDEMMNLMYGILKENSLKKACWNYVCPFGLEKGILELLINQKETYEHFCVVLIEFLVNYMMESPRGMSYILNIRPHNFISGTFIDWFPMYVDFVIKYDNNTYTTTKNTLMTAKLVALPEKLEKLKTKILEFANIQDAKIFAVGNNPYIAYNSYYNNDLAPQCFEPVWKANPSYIIGKTLGYEVLNSVILDFDMNKTFRINFTLVRIGMIESNPTGISNLSIPPQYVLSDLSINNYCSSDPAFSNFIDSQTKHEILEAERIANCELFEDNSKAHEETPEKQSLKSVVFADDTEYLNIPYILRICVENQTDNIYNLKLQIRGGNGNNFDNQDLFAIVRPKRREQVIFHVCLNDITKNFKGLTVNAACAPGSVSSVQDHDPTWKSRFREILRI